MDTSPRIGQRRFETGIGPAYSISRVIKLCKSGSSGSERASEARSESVGQLCVDAHRGPVCNHIESAHVVSSTYS